MNGPLTPVVTFSFATFVGFFPEFAAINPTLASAYFIRATSTIIDNTQCNPAFPDHNLPYLVYLATAHVAWLNSPKDLTGLPTDASTVGAQPASPLVGRVSQASEGSVSLSTEYPLDGSSSAQEKYLAQTKYGIELWAATAQYRTAQYAARPTYVFGGRFRSPLGYRSGGRFWWH